MWNERRFLTSAMTNSQISSDTAAARFFDKYLLCISKAKIYPKQWRWYVKHFETFIKAQNEIKIKSASPEIINNYFETLGRQKHLKGWQFIQNIRALQILYFELFALPLCQQVDWDFLKVCKTVRI